MINFNSSECIGCGMCIEVCAGGAFLSEPGYAVRFIEESCLECLDCYVEGICAGECVSVIDDENETEGAGW